MINNLQEATLKQLNEFVHNCLAVKGKRGNYIHVNVFKWSKQEIIDLITNAHYADVAIKWINGEQIFA